jgi:CheY-like chemotaxis protein
VQKDIEACFLAGADGYIAKPFTNEELKNKMTTILQFKSSPK